MRWGKGQGVLHESKDSSDESTAGDINAVGAYCFCICCVPAKVLLFLQLVVLAAMVAVARGGAVGLAAAPAVAAPVVAAPVAAKFAAPVVAAPAVAARLEEYDPLPQYTYAYDVQDALTGDSKNQFETRNGDIVQGR